MGIPAPQAFAPTALRNVAAGLVVGNPIGSSGTRGKALTSAELKAIVEASGISYLPLAGGTLTGSITGTSNTIQQRNGLNAQCLQIYSTYTSDTAREWLDIKKAADDYEISSAKGSVSGNNRLINFGQRLGDGTFMPVMSIGTDGSGRIGIGTSTPSSMLEVSAGTPVITITGTGGARGLALRNGTTEFASMKGTFTTGELAHVAGYAGYGGFHTFSTNGVERLRIESTGILTVNGAITPATLTDAAAPNGTIYYSSTQSKLVYKNSGGTVNVLY